MVLSLDDCVPHIFSVEVLNQLSIERQQCVSVVSTPSPCWMDPIVSFITDNVLPSEAKEVENEGLRLGFGYLKTKGCTDNHLEDHICYVFTLGMWRVSQLSCMEEFAEVIWGDDGQTCKGMPLST